MKNEKLQPTNNNVSKFTNNKRHACIAQNYKLKVTKLQVYKFTILQICKLQDIKKQITSHKFHIHKFTILQLKFIILN